jgi:hypothetical protein
LVDIQHQRTRLNIQCSNKALPAMTVQTLHLVGKAFVNLILAISGPSCLSVKKNLSAAAVRYSIIVRLKGVLVRSTFQRSDWARYAGLLPAQPSEAVRHLLSYLHRAFLKGTSLQLHPHR